MKSLALIPLLALAACQASPSASNEAVANTSVAVEPPQHVWARAADGTTVYGAYYKAENPKAVILLFHQAGSSKEEYATIAPRLVQAGYSALAIDQRSGGNLFGTNETAAKLGRKAIYSDAEQDMVAAVKWAQPVGVPVILWGSSYSASLVFSVANTYPGVVKAILAFSPGEYFPDKHSTYRAAQTLNVPAFVTSSSDAEEVAAAKALVDAVPGGKAEQYVPAVGVHGSSTLIAAKDPKGAEANWKPVMAFLKKVAP
jgi:dienelactone hydrolase